MCGGLWPRGLEPRWHSRVICWTFNLFCLLPRLARRCSSPSFPREIISPYRAYVPRLMRSKVVFEYLRVAVGRFSVHDDQKYVRLWYLRIKAVAMNFTPWRKTREEKRTFAFSHSREITRYARLPIYIYIFYTVIYVSIIYYRNISQFRSSCGNLAIYA